ncbi:MAG: hypothetical protein ACI8V2_001935 [Candidatus Latescibacterota bacterium]|jgi:hypothetical protein
MKRLAIVIVLLAMGTSASAWWPRGHGILTRAAVEALPADFPAFMKSGVGMVAHASVDPDLSKWIDASHPLHYFNAELVEGQTLPESRFEFGRLCDSLDIKIERVGLLPYAAAEATEQLAFALAEYRKWPEHPYIQNKCLLYAGLVAHYAQELCQPLNLTIYWNGRGEDGKPKNTRLHEKIDGLIQNVELKPAVIAADLVPEAADSLMGAIVTKVADSRKYIDQALSLEKYLSTKDVDYKSEADVQKFAIQQAREAASFTAVLYLTAWQQSASIRLPGWVDRGDMDHFGRPKTK